MMTVVVWRRNNASTNNASIINEDAMCTALYTQDQMVCAPGGGLYTPPHILVDSMYTIGSLQGVYRDFSGTAQGVHGYYL
jgi:hypothetical protein